MLEISGFGIVLAFGCFGGVLAEAWRWYKIRESPNLPSYLKSRLYWTITGIMILSGGFLACLYGTENVDAFLVLNIGASAPLIISALASTAPPLAQGAKPIVKRTSQLVSEFLSGR